MSKLTSILLTIVCCLFTFCMKAQDCTLDIGGENSEAVMTIFQLNDTQQSTMESLKGELQITTKGLEDEIQKLFDTHPQSTQEELITLSDKYKVLKQKMMNASWEADAQLLATFNSKQYQRYLDLCKEALRKPIKIIPVSYKDSIAPE